MINDYNDELTRDTTLDVSEQSFVGPAATAIIGGHVKDGGAAGDWATGDRKVPHVRITAALAGAGCTGVTVDVVCDTAADLVTAPTVLSTKTILAADAVINSIHAMPPLLPGTRKRYLGVKMTPNGAASTAGKMIVGLHRPGELPQNRVSTL